MAHGASNYGHLQRRGAHVETEVSVARGHTYTYQDGRKRFTNHIMKVSGEGRAGPSSSYDQASESNEKSLVWGLLWLGAGAGARILAQGQGPV